MSEKAIKQKFILLFFLEKYFDRMEYHDKEVPSTPFLGLESTLSYIVTGEVKVGHPSKLVTSESDVVWSDAVLLKTTPSTIS